MTITVLIPAYDAAPFLADTVRSVLAQTFGDILVRIAVEPGEADAPHEPAATLEALRPFRADPRVEIVVNPQRRGWTGNINALIASVTTPLFAILPHDDLWHPRYLEVLEGMLREDADAGLAYCDMRSYAGRRSWRTGLPIRRSGAPIDQVFEFFAEGPRGMPWRGLTRTAVAKATGGFPDADAVGISAEAEYALRLVAAAPVLHIPDVLYVKRMHAGNRRSAAQVRLDADLATRRAGFAASWDAMAAVVVEAAERAALTPDDRAVLDALVLARRLARRLTILGEPLAEADHAAIAAARERPAAIAAALGSTRFGQMSVARAMSSLHVTLCEDARLRGDAAAETKNAEDANAWMPSSPDALVCRARVLVAAGRPLEAIAVLEEARRLTPYNRQVDRLLHGLVAPLTH